MNSPRNNLAFFSRSSLADYTGHLVVPALRLQDGTLEGIHLVVVRARLGGCVRVAMVTGESPVPVLLLWSGKGPAGVG